MINLFPKLISKIQTNILCHTGKQNQTYSIFAYVTLSSDVFSQETRRLVIYITYIFWYLNFLNKYMYSSIQLYSIHKWKSYVRKRVCSVFSETQKQTLSELFHQQALVSPAPASGQRRRRRKLHFSFIYVFTFVSPSLSHFSRLLGEGPGLSFFSPARLPCARESILCRFALSGSEARSWRWLRVAGVGVLGLKK